LRRVLAGRLGPRAITLGASITTLGTIVLVITGARYGASLTGWDLAPMTLLLPGRTALRPVPVPEA
jgi:hypothetical protein